MNEPKYQKNLCSEIYSWKNDFKAVAIAIYHDDILHTDYLTYSTVNNDDDIFYPWKFYKCIYVKADLRNVTVDMDFVQNLMKEIMINLKRVEEQKLLCAIEKDFI